ncbi:hypothetical protein S7711_03856 [Stachybotrys chartarum IBT 7711]|uniref:Fungal-type protein kinase domain-containing protein n=1 Tax=Stachybotrys chartarum (strain CBS 109288 / IBT 7711) TaxID=1280523 RepID=A0A084AHT0_STACB|nr:hypothetical protein S7711_03856 [Stachybotrys chartarum IBT 7711]
MEPDTPSPFNTPRSTPQRTPTVALSWRNMEKQLDELSIEAIPVTDDIQSPPQINVKGRRYILEEWTHRKGGRPRTTWIKDHGVFLLELRPGGATKPEAEESMRSNFDPAPHTFFGAVPDLESASEAVFKKCIEGDNPLSDKGWKDWPEDANQDRVLSWFGEIIERLWDLANEHKSTTTLRRRPLAQPNKPIQGSTAERKLDIGFVSDPDAKKDSRHHWSQILVPEELKSNPSADTASKAWLDLGRYAREVLAAQGIASPKFDVNQDAEQFVSTILGFLWMNEEGLGFDPTIISAEGKRYIEIKRNGQTERLIIDRLMKRAPCVAGRATTCWRAHREGDKTPLVIKDSWQYPERREEGELLQEATAKGVANVARYYHHETRRDKLAPGESHTTSNNLDRRQCIHYDGPNQGRVIPEFDQWNFMSVESLAELKKGRVSDEGDFIKTAKENFTKYYQPLIPWVNKLCKAMFPSGGRWKKEDAVLYYRMKKILHDAQEDLEVLAGSE